MGWRQFSAELVGFGIWGLKVIQKNYPQSYLSNKEQERESKKEEITSSRADLNQLNKEEINRLKEFLKTIQDGGASYSIAQQGKQVYFTPFLASNTERNNTWILDLWATNHMTPNFYVFETYEHFETTKRITIAN